MGVQGDKDERLFRGEEVGRILTDEEPNGGWLL